MINILILMGGKGTRFADAGYKELKPLIKVKGRTLTDLSCSCLKPTKYDYRFIFVYSPEQDKDFREEVMKVDNNGVVVFDNVLRGMAPGALMATDYIDNDDSLIIASCDQTVDWNMDDYLDFAMKTDGCILTTPSDLENRSYSKLVNDLVVEVAEKRVISNNSHIGVYFFKRGRDFVKSAIKMISKEIKTNDQFYLAPVYNEMLDKIVRIYPIDNNKVSFLGTPKDLEEYANTETTTRIG